LHCATQQAAGPRLQRIIYRLVCDHRLRVSRLCRVPIILGTVKPWAERGFELVILRPFAQMVPPVFIAKTE